MRKAFYFFGLFALCFPPKGISQICTRNDRNRDVDCGFSGISREDCENRQAGGHSCCFDNSESGTNYCYPARQALDGCQFDIERQPCSDSTRNGKECLDAGCCFDSSRDECFKKVSTELCCDSFGDACNFITQALAPDLTSVCIGAELLCPVLDEQIFNLLNREDRCYYVCSITNTVCFSLDVFRLIPGLRFLGGSIGDISGQVCDFCTNCCARFFSPTDLFGEIPFGKK